MNKLTKFHIDHNYYVKIKSLPNMIGCCVSFPTNLLHQLSGLNRTYIINDDGNQIEIYHLEESKEITSNTIHTTRFSVRTLILEDVLVRTLARKMSQTLLVVEDNDAKSNLFDILPIPMDDEEKVLERELCLKFRDLILGKVDYDVNDSKLLPSYEMLVSCFEKGGL